MSQSLMSLGGSIFALLALAGLGAARSTASPWAKRAFWIGLAWTLFSTADLLLRASDERTGHTLGTLPLMLVPLAALFAVPSKLLKKPERLAWPLALTAIALLVSIGRGAYQFLILGEHATGWLRNPIYYAYNLLPACVFFGELYLSRMRFGRFRSEWCGLLALAAVGGIFFAVSRMALACALVYLCFRWAPRIRERAGSKGLSLAVLLLLSFGVSVYRLSPTIQAKVAQTTSSDDPSRQWRLVAWKHNWNLFLSSPLVGVGPEKNGIDPAKMPEYQGHWTPNHLFFAHSIYLQALAESGLIGTALLAAYWIALPLAAPTLIPIALTLAIAGLTENIFNNSKPAHAFLFYALLATLMGRFLRRPNEPA